MHQKTIDEAKKRLFRGELVIFPTETVYGIGGNAKNEDAIKLIYQVKRRPFDNPLICHFANIREIEKNFILKDKDYELANTFWPGPLTLILEKNTESKITPLLSNNQNFVGCRIPNNEIALNLLSQLDFPIAAPSANIAAKTSITSIKDLDDNLKKNFYIDGGASVLGLESTVIQTTKEGCQILRLGSLTIEEIKYKFLELKNPRKLYHETIEINGEKPSEISTLLQEKIKNLLEYHNHELIPMIRIILKGVIHDGFIPSDISVRALTKKYTDRAIINVGKNKLISKKLNKKSKLINDLKTKKISIEDLGLKILGQKLNIEKIDKLESIFSVLKSGDLEKAEEIL